jgi:hypothetical protein
VLAGGSQGGAVAVAEALSGKYLGCRGFLAVAPSFGLSWANTHDVADLRALIRSGAERGLRGAVLAGEEDPLLAGAEQLRDEAAKADFPLQLEVERGLGHDFPPAFEPKIARALDFVLAAERTDL